MGKFGQQLGMAGVDLAKDAVSAGLGLALQRGQDKRQKRMAEKLQRMQMEGDKEMTDYNMNKQLELWEKTSFPAQMEQLKKAGLNPGLIYGMGGAGGQSSNVDTGSTTTGTAPTGGGEIQAMMGLGLQRQMIQAQTENIKAQTQKTIAETQNVPLTGKNIQASTSSLLQGIDNAKAQQELTEVQTSIASMEEHIKGMTQNAQVAMIMQNLRSNIAAMEMLERDNDISRQTKEQKIQQIILETIYASLKNDLTQQQTAESKQQVQQSIQEILQKWKGLSLEERKTIVTEKLKDVTVGTAKQEMLIKLFEALEKTKKIPSLPLLPLPQ